MSIDKKPHRTESREEILGELEEFEREREQLKEVLGRIGGQSFSKKDNWVNIGFLVVILGLFVAELTTDYLPRLMSLELGVLMVSIKIVFMIHSQQKVNHFEFWILNSIEFRMNDMSKRVRNMERRMTEDTK
ncbi:MAG: hypothetical protein DRZ90_07295 [Spirochaetes bacterium]|nr:MAG: hypothetical protein DRZ90_07295 [Spirochaetota bacterium]